MGRGVDRRVIVLGLLVDQGVSHLAHACSIGYNVERGWGEEGEMRWETRGEKRGE